MKKTFPRRLAPALAACALATLAATGLAPLTVSAQAQEAPAQSPYGQLYDAMSSGVDENAAFEGMLRAVARQMVLSDPAVREAEKASPGLVTALIDAMRPALRAYSDRVRAAYRPRMEAAMAEVLTREEAVALAGFYNSPIGRRLMGSMSGNLQVDAMVDSHLSQGQVSADAVQQDLGNSALAVVGQLTQEERASLVRAALATPGFAKMPLLQQRVVPIRAEMENAPPSPQEEAALMAAVSAVVAERTQ